MGLTDCQAAQQCGWYERVFRKLFRNLRRKFGRTNAVSGKSIVTKNPPFRVRHHKWRRHLPFGVLASLLSKVVVEFRNTAGKGGAIVVSEWLKRVSERGRAHRPTLFL